MVRLFRDVIETTTEDNIDEPLDIEKFGESAVLKMLEEYDEIQRERNQFAANRINRALKDGETGILVFGGYHFGILAMLDKDIEVRFPNREIEGFVMKYRERFSLSPSEFFRKNIIEGQINQAPENKG